MSYQVPSRRKIKHYALAFLFLMLVNFPLLSIANRQRFIGKIPLLYVYLFGIWAMVILVLFVADFTDRKKRRNE